MAKIADKKEVALMAKELSVGVIEVILVFVGTILLFAGVISTAIWISTW
jgi:hypothetical protein